MGSDKARQIRIPQPIPSEVCLACDVCCRFPEEDSFLTPVFTDQEIAQTTGLRGDQAQFRPVFPSTGGQVVTVRWGGQFRCPFFDPEKQMCIIYDKRPLDCKLYPYALMLDPSSSGVWLGIDTKCPAIHDPNLMPSLVTNGGRIWEAAISSDLIDRIERTPRLVGPYQPDVLPLFRLDELSAALLSTGRLIPWKSPSGAFPQLSFPERAAAVPPRVPSTRPLTPADRATLERYLGQIKPQLAAHTFALQFMAGDLISLVWCEFQGFFCLWALDNGTVYMPLPPLGSGDFRGILSGCFAFMDQQNTTPEISRIHNVSLSQVPNGGLLGFAIRPGYPDYVYQRRDLVELRGRPLRRRRSDYRAFAKGKNVTFRPYHVSDETACLAVFDRWQAHRMGKTDDPVARKLLEDARSCHLRALRLGEAMGLIGRVVSLGERPLGYTFGVPLNEETFVVGLEATDPLCRGASAFIFREFSKELEGYTYINIMDDSGLPGLRRLKRSYGPWRLEPSLVLSRC